MFARLCLVVLLFNVVSFAHQLRLRLKNQVQTTDTSVPPYDGTIFIDGDIIDDKDKSEFKSAKYVDMEVHNVYDRRTNAWSDVNLLVFQATAADGIGMTFWVNPELGDQGHCQSIVVSYATTFMRLPVAIRQGSKTMVIHGGTALFGGAPDTGIITVHVGQGQEYQKDHILEEALCHEGTHASLDAKYLASPQWLAAAKKDNNYISTYAHDYPDREDLAESFVPYLGVVKKRVSQTDENKIRGAMPHRIAFLDSLKILKAQGVSMLAQPVTKHGPTMKKHDVSDRVAKNPSPPQQHTTSPHTTSPHTTSPHTTPPHTTPPHTTPQHTTPQHTPNKPSGPSKPQSTTDSSKSKSGSKPKPASKAKHFFGGY